jgi:hypothetical protein
MAVQLPRYDQYQDAQTSAQFQHWLLGHTPLRATMGLQSGSGPRSSIDQGPDQPLKVAAPSVYAGKRSEGIWDKLFVPM